MACGTRELDGLVQGGMGGDARQVLELIHRQSKDRSEDRVDLTERPRAALVQQRVQLGAPSKGAVGQLEQQAAIAIVGEPFSGALDFGRERGVTALDGDEDRERRLTY